METEKPKHNVVMRRGKTRQDQMPVEIRPRVKEWQRRIDKMQGKKVNDDDLIGDDDLNW